MKFCLNILIILSILVGVCLIAVCIISYIENRRLSVTRYVVADELVPAAFDGLHIVQLSDLHNACFGAQNERLVRRVRDLQPDFIFVTGDVIIASPEQDVDLAAATLNRLADIAPLYFSMGNHELRISLYAEDYGNMWERFLKQLDSRIHLLSDERAELEKDGEKLYLYGVTLNPGLYRRFTKMPMEPDYLESIFGTCDSRAYHIFLAHNPIYFEEYVKWGANLTFSGHIHGGMIRLPIFGGVLSPMVQFFPKYDRGLFPLDGKYMILSGGLGNHTLKFRINNLPELVSVTLRRK